VKFQTLDLKIQFDKAPIALRVVCWKYTDVIMEKHGAPVLHALSFGYPWDYGGNALRRAVFIDGLKDKGHHDPLDKIRDELHEEFDNDLIVKRLGGIMSTPPRIILEIPKAWVWNEREFLFNYQGGEWP
jgi:hypothetical protein